MPQLNYLAPSTAEEAVKALSAANARPLAGGTDLLVQIRAGRVRPDVIVDLKGIAGAKGVRSEAGGFVIGAATSGAELSEHAALVRAWPGVVEGANLIGSTQIQSRATMAGNLCNGSPAAGRWPIGFPPDKRNQYDLATIARWLEVFLRRFFAFSQFKRSAIPNGPKVSTAGALSPRGDWRAPSDGTARPWLDELAANLP